MRHDRRNNAVTGVPALIARRPRFLIYLE